MLPPLLTLMTDPNALADLVVGYMGVPYEGVDMTSHRQYVTVRNGRGQELLNSINGRLEVSYETMLLDMSNKGKIDPIRVHG